MSLPSPVRRLGRAGKQLLRAMLGENGYLYFLKWVLVASYLIKNLRARLGATPATPWVCEFGDFDPARSSAYAREEFEDYLRYGGLRAETLNGLRVLEVGPGENLGVAIRFCLAGAEVTCADRFPSLRPAADQARVYRLMEEELGRGSILGTLPEIKDGPVEFVGKRLSYLPGAAAEDLAQRLTPASFDLIVSRAVLEHVFDPDRALSALDVLLKPGGTMIHEIDFRDHGIFTAFGMHPLTYLTFPERLWRALSSHIGAPNRRLLGYFAERFASMGYRCDILKIFEIGSNEKMHEPISKGISTATQGRVESIRPRLSQPFAAMPVEELGVSAIFLKARKPGSAQTIQTR